MASSLKRHVEPVVESRSAAGARRLDRGRHIVARSLSSEWSTRVASLMSTTIARSPGRSVARKPNGRPLHDRHLVGHAGGRIEQDGEVERHVAGGEERDVLQDAVLEHGEVGSPTSPSTNRCRRSVTTTFRATRSTELRKTGRVDRRHDAGGTDCTVPDGTVERTASASAGARPSARTRLVVSGETGSKQPTRVSRRPPCWRCRGANGVPRVCAHRQLAVTSHRGRRHAQRSAPKVS